jgi:mycofactocin precursor
MATVEPAPNTVSAPAEHDALTGRDDDRRDAPAASPADRLIESDLLVEDVSIDGMCGVY